MQDTQLPPPSPPLSTITPVETIKIKDVVDTSCQNINPLTYEQQEQSVQDTQLPPPSPPHSTITPIETIKIKDVVETSCQNINPLTAEDLTKILDQSTQVARLCTSPILVSVDEL